MNLHDFLIEHSTFESSKLPEYSLALKVWLVNRSGDGASIRGAALMFANE